MWIKKTCEDAVDFLPQAVVFRLREAEVLKIWVSFDMRFFVPWEQDRISLLSLSATASCG